jgi:hypothetical protein
MKWPSWFPIGSHERLSIVLTALIALLTAGNVFVAGWYASITKKAADDSGKQTERLIGAANIQANSAQKIADASDKNAAAAEHSAAAAAGFAKSAAGINAGMQVTVNELQRMVDAANKANKNSQIALEAQTRPWVGIDGPIVTKIANPQASGMLLTIKFRNYGQSPAIIGANPPFVLTFGGGHGFWCNQYKLWEAGEQPLDATGYGKYLEAIFPGNEGITKNVWAAYKEGVNLDTPKLVLAGCITYESATNVRYRTEFTYQVSRREDGKMEFERTDAEPR